MTKRIALAGLIVLNVALAAGVLTSAFRPEPAFAQGTGLAGNYLAVTGEVQDQFDALYLLDMRTWVLHAFHYDRGPRRLAYADSRDLQRDFRSNRD